MTMAIAPVFEGAEKAPLEVLGSATAFIALTNSMREARLGW